MNRPTKEEAREYARHVLSDHSALARCAEIDPDELYAWLQRVAAALPSAAAVQQDRERRDEICPICRTRYGHGPDCERNPDRPAD